MALRVAHVIGGLFYGGGQRVVYDLLKDPVEGLTQELWLLGDQGNSHLNPIANKVFPYDGRYNRLGTLHSVAKSLRSWIHLHQVDIVHSHGMDADMIVAWAVGKMGPKHIAHLHSMPNMHSKSWKAMVRTQLYKWLMRKARTRFVAVAEAVKRENAISYGLRNDLIVTIPNGVDLREFGVEKSNRKPSPPIVFGFAGRLVEIKGVDVLMDAVEFLHSRSVSFTMLFAGTGNRESQLRNRVRQIGCESQVQFLGNVEDMRNFYKKIDVLVLPSLSEGMPLVVLEAMAGGLPVIATDVGGTRELVQHEIDGWLVPPRNGAALAAAMHNCSLLNDLAGYGNRGLAKVNARHCITKVRQELKILYEFAVRQRDIG